MPGRASDRRRHLPRVVRAEGPPVLPVLSFRRGPRKRRVRLEGRRFAKGTWVLLDLYGTNHNVQIWGGPEAFRPERFSRWDGSALDFVPQGCGDHYQGHRCAGEWITIELAKRAVRLLTESMSYQVPQKDLSIDLSRMPAVPESRFVIGDVRLAR